MILKQKDFVITLENDESPIIITIPHGGMSNTYGSWLELLYKKRVKSENEEENIIKGEKIAIGGDNQILHMVMDIINVYPANIIIGLLPRVFVDYNRFVPEVAYADKKIRPLYQAYHRAINSTIKRIKENRNFCEEPVLFDFHGFAKQPIEGRNFDIILGTNGESSPSEVDKKLYNHLHEKYEIFCAGMDGLPNESELYKGDETNLHYFKKHKIDGILVEIAPKFRSTKIEESKENGKKLSKDFGDFFGKLAAGMWYMDDGGRSKWL